MTGKVVGWAMEQVCGSPITKLVLIKLADNANDLGFCFPSIDLIVEHTELSERAVRKHLYELEKLGYIRIDRRIEEGVHFRNRYFLNIPAAEPREAKSKGIARRATPMQAEQNQRLEEKQPVVPQNSGAQEVDAFEVTPIAPGAIPMHGAPDGAAPEAGAPCTPSNTPLHEVPVHIDEPPREPSREPSLQTGGRAQDVPKVEPKEMPTFLRRFPDENFHRFLRAYPETNEGPAQTFKAWKATEAIRPPIEELLAAVAYCITKKAQENRTRPADDQGRHCHASRWLNEQRWFLNALKPAPSGDDPDAKMAARRHAWGGHPAVEELCAEVGEGIYDALFAVCRLSFVEGTAMVTSPSKFRSEKLEAEYGELLAEKLKCPVVYAYVPGGNDTAVAA